MVMDAFGNLALSWKSILRTFTEAPQQTKFRHEDPKTNPAMWWMGGLVAGALAAFVSKSVFDIPVWMTLVAVDVLGARHDCRAADWVPTSTPSGYGTQLTFGARLPEAPRRT